MKQYDFYGWEKADVKDEFGFTPRDYYDMLDGIWSKDTCAPRYRTQWSTDNKTLGQCSITAFAVQDILGGQVLGVKLSDGAYHCFNKVGDCVFDLTSEQFGNVKLNYENCPVQLREEHFAVEEKKQRYLVLKEQLLKAIHNKLRSDYMEEQIITVTIKTKGEKCELTDEQIRSWYQTAVKKIFDPKYGTPEIDVKVERKDF